MKILFLSNKYPPDVIGGAEIVAASVCEDLAQRGHEVHVLTARAGRGLVETVRRNGVTVHCVWPGSAIFPPGGMPRMLSLAWQMRVHALDLWNLGVAREMQRLCSALRPDIVHTQNLYGFSPIAWRTAKKLGLPLVHTVHDCYLLSPTGNLLYGWEEDNALKRFFRAAYRRWYLHWTDCVDVFCSPSRHHLDLHRRLGCRAADYRVVRNGVKEEGIDPDLDNARDQHPLRVLYLGRLESHKGVPVLLRAAEMLAGSPISLAIAGAGPLEPEVSRAAEKLPMLKFEGFVAGEKRRSLFRQSDLLVFPSICLECFGTVVFEALACGVPVAVTDIGGPTELVEAGLNGFNFPPDDAGALAGLLRELSASPERVRSLRRNAAASARGGTVEHMTDEYLAVYKKLLGN